MKGFSNRVAAAAWLASVAVALCSFAQGAKADEVITDIAHWNHPTKSVFAKHGLELTKVELIKNGKFPIFHVKVFPGDPELGINNSFFAPLEYEVLMANGKWPLRIVSDQGSYCGIDVSWDKKSKSASESLSGC